METANVEKCVVSDHVAEMVLQMARRFYSNPENVKKYEVWYLKEHGCLPNHEKGSVAKWTIGK